MVCSPAIRLVRQQTVNCTISLSKGFSYIAATMKRIDKSVFPLVIHFCLPCGGYESLSALIEPKECTEETHLAAIEAPKDHFTSLAGRDIVAINVFREASVEAANPPSVDKCRISDFLFGDRNLSLSSKNEHGRLRESKRIGCNCQKSDRRPSAIVETCI